MRRRLILCALAVVLAAVTTEAQRTVFRLRIPFAGNPSSNPIAAGRLPAGDTSLPNAIWAAAGVTGGIPTRSTRCGSVIAAYTGTAGTINTAISGCTANQYVELGAGTFTLSSGITFAGKDNVTLRGQGADSTFLVFSGDVSCGGLFAGICSGASGGYYADAADEPAHVANWTAGYTQGATSITVSATTGLSVNMWIVLDQQNDAADTGDVYVCQSCSDEGGSTNQRSGRAQREWHKVTAINGTTLTISPGLIMPNWRSGQNPSAWWGDSGDITTGNGIENLSLDMNTTQTRCILLFYNVDSWVKGVRCLRPEGDNNFVEFGAILIYGGAHNTLRDSYIWGNQGLWASGTYGFTTYGSGHNLIENNFGANRCCMFFINGDIGSVIAYNYALDSRYDASATFLQASNYMHEGGSAMTLNEGNDSVGAKHDIVHSSSNLFTYHRNRFVGTDVGKSVETVPVKMYALNRYMAFTGNVVGDSAYHSTYQSASSNTAIWALGSAGNTVSADTLVDTTSMRWGNWDVVTSTNDNGTNDTTGIKWASGEVPTGLSVLPNTLPGANTVPNSFYLSATPAFFTNAGVTWPPIGPDVTNGNVSNTGGHANKIPARVCYESLSNDAGYADPGSGHERAKTFNAATCYE